MVLPEKLNPFKFQQAGNGRAGNKAAGGAAAPTRGAALATRKVQAALKSVRRSNGQVGAAVKKAAVKKAAVKKGAVKKGAVKKGAGNKASANAGEHAGKRKREDETIIGHTVGCWWLLYSLLWQV
jgi:hypothetical protein